MKMVKINMPELKKESPKAWAFDIGETKQYTKAFYTKHGTKGLEQVTESVLTWFPKSQCQYDGQFLIMPEWLAKKTGCIIAIKHGMGEYIS